MFSPTRNWSIPRKAKTLGGYAAVVLGTGPIQYLKLNGDATDASGNGCDGSASNVTWDAVAGPGASMGLAPSFNGTSSRINIYSLALQGLLSVNAGSLSIWIKTNQWSTAALRWCIEVRTPDANNLMQILNGNTSNTLLFSETSNATNKQITYATSRTDWFNAILTWDHLAGANGEFKTYINGTQNGSTTTNIAAWANTTLHTMQCMVGAQSTTPFAPFNGNLAHAAVWARALTAAEALAVGTAI